jgi:hypothetical protein
MDEGGSWILPEQPPHGQSERRATGAIAAAAPQGPHHENTRGAKRFGSAAGRPRAPAWRSRGRRGGGVVQVVELAFAGARDCLRPQLPAGVAVVGQCEQRNASIAVRSGRRAGQRPRAMNAPPARRLSKQCYSPGRRPQADSPRAPRPIRWGRGTAANPARPPCRNR